MKTLKDWMEGVGLDQKALAPMLGVAQSTLSRVLNGQDPSGDFIRAAHRISEGEVEPNSFFPELFAESTTAKAA